MGEPDPRRVRELFLEALDLEPGVRDDFVANAAGDDRALADAVLVLLRRHEDAGATMEPRDETRGLGLALLDVYRDERGRGAPVEPPDLVGALVGDTFRLAERLGEGTFGVVYAAKDELTCEDVAVKILLRWPERLGDWLLREAGTLLLLDVPGLVNWRDHGTFEGSRYVVTDLVDGRPFPGCATPATWIDIAPAAVDLLAALARLHAEGVVHGDLKPANVLVGEHAQVTLLDLGSCVGPAVAGLLDDRHTLVGTLSHLAPEQLGPERAGPSERTDLYAAGVLLYAALVGAIPHERLLRDAFVRERANEPVDFGLLPDLPPVPRRLIEQLLACDPAERSASAAEARARLLGARPPIEFVERRVAEAGCNGAPIPAEMLRSLFRGHERLFHVPEDAAELLLARTGGVPARVEAELTAWIRAGLAHVDYDGIVTDRASIERLESESVPSARAGTPDPADTALNGAGILRDAGRRARRLYDEGRPARAAALIRATLAASRHVDVDAAEREALLRALLEAALAQGVPRAFELARYELERAPDTDGVRWLHALNRAAALAIDGHGRAALGLTDALPAAADPTLDVRRHAVAVFAANRGAPDRLERVLEVATRWADARDETIVRRQAAEWRGSYAYKSKRYADAASLFESALELAESPMTQLSVTLRAASAYLEVPRLDRAAALGRDAVELARGGRHPYFEARAERVVRAALYRSGEATSWDRELVEAAADIPVPLEVGLICLNEAAVAWRAGQREAARRLGLRSADLMTRAGARSAAALARALAFAANSSARRAPARGEVERVAASGSPSAALQTLALFATGAKENGEALPRDLLDRVPALADAIVTERRRHRRDVLSIDEALEMLAD